MAAWTAGRQTTTAAEPPDKSLLILKEVNHSSQPEKEMAKV
jgi:hypothetical protein